MNRMNRSSFPMAMAMIALSAHTAACARLRTSFDDVNYTGKGLAKLTADGETIELGGEVKRPDAVDTNTAIGQDQQTNTAQQLQQDQANTAKVDSTIKVAGSIVDQTQQQQQQQQGGPGAPQADAEPKAGIEVKAAETKLDDPAAGERQLG